MTPFGRRMDEAHVVDKRRWLTGNKALDVLHQWRERERVRDEEEEILL